MNFEIFSRFTAILTIIFAVPSLIMIYYNKYGINKTGCNDDKNCKGSDILIIVIIVLLSLIVITPYLLKLFFSNEVSLFIHATILFCSIYVMLPILAIIIQNMIKIGSTSESNSRMKALQGVIYTMCIFGLVNVIFNLFDSVFKIKTYRLNKIIKIRNIRKYRKLNKT